MRIVLMLLLLVNLGFFAWQHWYGADAENRALTGQRDAMPARSLRLVGETDTSVTSGISEPVPEPVGQAVRTEAEPEQQGSRMTESLAASQDASPRCATLGPFDQRDLAELARERLAAPGLPAAVRESGGQIRSGFWVYLPPFASRDAAKRIEDELRVKGVLDLFIVTDSEQRNAISLGLFSTPERADQRAAEIGRLGYAPRVAERFRDATVYWVDFHERPGDPLEPESVGVRGTGDTLPEKHDISCDDIAAEAGAA